MPGFFDSACEFAIFFRQKFQGQAAPKVLEAVPASKVFHSGRTTGKNEAITFQQFVANAATAASESDIYEKFRPWTGKIFRMRNDIPVTLFWRLLTKMNQPFIDVK